MPTIAELKAQTQALIEARSAWLIDVAKTILAHPEPGFQEVTTARLVSEKLHELGIAHDTGLALTGIKGYIRGGTPGPTVAVIGELDSLRVPGHPHANPDTGAAHACGHHCQIGMMLGAAVGLKALEGQEALAGNLCRCTGYEAIYRAIRAAKRASRTAAAAGMSSSSVPT